MLVFNINYAIMEEKGGELMVDAPLEIIERLLNMHVNPIHKTAK